MSLPQALRPVPRAIALVVACALCACAVGPNFHEPSADQPASFAANFAGKPAAIPNPIDPAKWWHALSDPELDSLVDRALQGNADLDIALSRLQEARTFEIALTGYALPRVEAGSGGGRGTGTDMTRGRAPSPLQSADHTLGGVSRITQVSGFDAGWDVDLFGRFRREIEAARFDAQAAAAARDAVQVAVIADVARAYIDLRGLQVQLAVLRENEQASKKLLDLVQARFDRGITNELDLTLAQRETATVESQVAPLAAQVDAAGYAIAVLLGRFPEEMKDELSRPGLLPRLPQQVDPGQPLDLIRRRPDVRAAEWELGAATAYIGVAVADLFPRLSLSAGLGVQGQGLGYAPQSSQRIWSAGYGAVLPLLDFGTLDSYVEIADLQARASLVNYKHTVQAAVQDVDTAMAAFRAQEDRLGRLGEAVAAGQRAMTLATERYDRGLTDFLNVVDAQRAEYELEGQYSVAETAAAEQFIALYRSLGGGWEQYSGPPALRTPNPAIVAMFRRLISP